MTGMPWLVVANHPVPGFEETLAFGGVRVYASGCAPAGTTFAVEPGGTAIHFDVDRVRVQVSERNTTPVYFALDQTTGRFVLGTDLPTTAAASAALTGESAVLRADLGVHSGSDSAVVGVSRLTHLADLDLRLESGTWRCSHTRRADPEQPAIRFHDAAAAGEAQVDALRLAIADALATEAEGEAGVLVSGGVDSGLVAALVARTGTPATAYTIGTEWGDEYDHAAEAAQAVGLDLRRTALRAEDIVEGLPTTVRAFGHCEPETIAIGVALAAFCRGGYARERLLFTGYGSDLLNSGMATTDEIDGDIGAKVRAAVDRTRYSSEFTRALGSERGYLLTHPYWHPGVLDVALATDPAVKSFRGREKGHLRLAARALLPEDVAWRRKTAIHHGNGLGANLAHLIDAHIGIPGSAPLLYRALLTEQIATAANNPLAPLLGHDAYHRAVATVARGH
ncbi:hypothetical protein JOD54_004169 [Actinokineospora baliensis]|uniref:asparagine synthase-related protein n=1 Tax=Actinokineospora baliensis TaxID=547056 RepID=UPI00195DC8DE|nr:asparagine synthase-related protein [Actinokineospora baliensis]MBM7773965.1 hypothetical protein [Actinokineospora baliensis]